MCVPPKTWNIAREPLLVAIYLINRILYSKEASRRQRKQLLPLVPKEAVTKEAVTKEAVRKEAVTKAAVTKEAVTKEAVSRKQFSTPPPLSAPLPHYKKNTCSCCYRILFTPTYPYYLKYGETGL